MVPSPCPPLAHLRQLVGGLIADAELADLTAHLSSCPACQATLDLLLACSGVWPVPPAPPDRVEPGPALAETLARLAHDPTPPDRPPVDSGAFAPLSKTSEIPVAPPTRFDFLEPADRPGYLGKLGPYEVTQVLGFGGMGVVLKAFDPNLQRYVAVKVLAAHLADNATARKRFIREARANAAVHHDNVVAVHAVVDADPVPYLVLEHVAGPSLQERLDQHGPFALPDILRVGRQTALGLAAAHAQGLIHRDVKPANILLEAPTGEAGASAPGWRVKLTDFGLARAVDDVALTHNGVIVGTPLYMAPEQARGEAIDQRADLFSLGSILYALCTGRPPFRAHSSVAVLKRICEDRPRPIHQVNPDIPPWLCDVIGRLHAKKPQDRFQSAQEVADLLGRHLAHLGPHDRGAAPAPGHRLWWAALLVALVVVVGLLIADRVFQTGVVFPAAEPARNTDGQAGAGGRREVPGKPAPDTPPHPRPLAKPRRFQLARVPAGGLALLPGGRRMVAVSNQEPALELVDLATGAVVPLRGHAGAVTALAVSPDGRLAVTGGADRTLRLWDLEKAELRTLFEGHVATVTAVALYLDEARPEKSLVFSAARDGTFRCWDLATGKELVKMDVTEGRLEETWAAVFRPTGAQVVTASTEGKVWLWDVAAHRAVGRPYSFSPADVLEHALSPDGARLAAADPANRLVIHEALAGRVEHRLEGHKAAVTGLAFSPKSQRQLLLSGDRAGTVLLWDVVKGQELDRFEGATERVVRVAFSTDGKHLMAVNAAGTVWVWDAPA
jgi:tRNA A-37 threonylcarbamoyl transferase component Bud32